MYYLIYDSDSYWRDLTTPGASVFPTGKTLGASASWPGITIGTFVLPMGFVLGIGLAVGLLVLIRSTRYGFEMRVVGDSPQAANYSGIRTKRKILGDGGPGGVAGIVGSSQIGDFGHMLDPRGLQQAQYGYTGIVVAALPALQPACCCDRFPSHRRPYQRRLRPRRAFVPNWARRHHGGDHPFHRSRRRDSRPLQDRVTPPGCFLDPRWCNQHDRGGVMNSNVVLAVVVSAIAFGTPLVIAGLGELLAERSGVLNLGVEGMMLMGAVTAFCVSQKMHGPAGLILLLAVLASLVAGAAMALIHAFLTITIRVNQIKSRVLPSRSSPGSSVCPRTSGRFGTSVAWPGITSSTASICWA